ncbi:MAG TPA: type II toxin-antitoxin system VapC family toxin [Solirubrobacteraceae bacterium]|nr:type II toxin-antitoxin system VapC family toxin [Solirubrobacteraceae bacterium]
MRLLLDTHVVLWQLGGDRVLPENAAAAIGEAEGLHYSAVSFAEIGIKVAVGKLTVPERLREQVQQAGAQILGLTPEHGLRVAELPLHHRDPFDRLLIAQALCEGLAIVTADSRFADYDVPLVPAADFSRRPRRA